MSFKRAQKTVPTKNNWFETSVNGGVLLLGVLQEAAGLTPVPYLKQAAGVTLKIIEAVQKLKENKADFRRLAQDATALIATIFDRYKNSPDQASWPPPEIAQIIYELVGTVEEILSFVIEQVHKNRAIRLMNSKADVGKVKEYRERLQAAVEKFQNILKISSHLNLNESVALILKKLDQQEQQAGSHPTPFEEVSEIQAKIEADRRRKKEMDAKAAEETRRKEIEAKQREVAESVESIRRAEAEAQERQQVQDEVQRLRVESELLQRQQDLARQQEELDEQRRQFAAEEQARKESASQRWSSTTPIRANSAGSGSTNADDPVVLDQAYKRYEENEQSYFSKPEPARKGSHSKKSKVEDYGEEESEELVNDSSEVSSTDEEERERRRRRQERRKTKKAASKKTGSAGQSASSGASSPSSPSTSTPQAQHQPFQQPPVSPPPPQIEEILVAHLARLGINTTTNQPYSPPPSQSPPYANPTGYASPQPGHHYSPPPPGRYPYYHTPPMPPFSPHGGYLSPPPGTIMYNSGNYSNNTISNVGNNNSRTVIQSPSKSFAFLIPMPCAHALIPKEPRRATSRRTGN
ncbi:hypothetical protein D9613_004581 [Agrocybe pediades]|uniref:Uncharacterized protein n=1 Tax=Agrocybe pediades TaxID=84607 RepID=A0A8H4QJI3_9AGAR|nr:hypothetical protein D9613_004581 [Agrocybe pediades]